MKQSKIVEKFRLLSFSVLGVLLALAGCTSPIAETGGGDDQGQLILNLEPSDMRTLLPGTEWYKISHYGLTFTPGPGNSNTQEPMNPVKSGATITLPSGAWTIRADAYTKGLYPGSDPNGVIVATGSAGVTIAPKKTGEARITVSASQAGNGTIEYTKSNFNSWAAADSAALTLKSLEAPYPVVWNISDIRTETDTSKELPGGFYLLTIEASKAGDGADGAARHAVKSEVVHIYDNAITKIPWKATDPDLKLEAVYGIEYLVSAPKYKAFISAAPGSAAEKSTPLIKINPGAGKELLKVTIRQDNEPVGSEYTAFDATPGSLVGTPISSYPWELKRDDDTPYTMPSADIHIDVQFKTAVTQIDMKPWYVRKDTDPNFKIQYKVIPYDLSDPNEHAIQEVTWTSSDTSVASIVGTGTTAEKEVEISINAPGWTRLTATSTDKPAVKGYTVIYVLDDAWITGIPSSWRDTGPATTANPDPQTLGNKYPATDTSELGHLNMAGYSTNTSAAADQWFAYKYNGPDTVNGAVKGSGLTFRSRIKRNASVLLPDKNNLAMNAWIRNSYDDSGLFYNLNGADNGMTNGIQSGGDLSLTVDPVLITSTDGVPYLMLIHSIRNTSTSSNIPYVAGDPARPGAKFGAAVNLRIGSTDSVYFVDQTPYITTGRAFGLWLRNQVNNETDIRMGFFTWRGPMDPNTSTVYPTSWYTLAGTGTGYPGNAVGVSTGNIPSMSTGTYNDGREYYPFYTYDPKLTVVGSSTGNPAVAFAWQNIALHFGETKVFNAYLTLTNNNLAITDLPPIDGLPGTSDPTIWPPMIP
jgi:hypothetical protein